jgi:hypothetical protein
MTKLQRAFHWKNIDSAGIEKPQQKPLEANNG